ncbi:MAG: protein-ADP-ribose hydrolase [Clostridia bacterium]|nr:protein-ADP-ribose hydrolase [Clostridia bacterium]
MTQEGRRKFLIEHLLLENHSKAKMPREVISQKRLLHALLNMRMPKTASEEFLQIQDEYLQEELRIKGVTDIADLRPIAPNTYLWQGDITTLKCDAIVNAANSQMLGCFCPNHGCIDNAIHTFAGAQLRLECAQIMSKQGTDEPTGRAKITGAYNLPCKFVFHTVGPIVRGALTQKNEDELASCYNSCLAIANKYRLQSIAFCCISTGEFAFPNERAAQIAVNSVLKYKMDTKSNIKVVFNVFKDLDYEIYSRLLGANK